MKFWHSSTTTSFAHGIQTWLAIVYGSRIHAIFFVDYDTTVNFDNPVLDDTRNNSGHITHQSVENFTANTNTSIYFLIRDIPGEI